jgi:hypothetical protein
MPGGRPRGIRRGGGVGDILRGRQVEQRASQAEVVTDLGRESRRFTDVSARFGSASGEEEIRPARGEQVAELAGIDAESLAEAQRFGGEPVGVRRPGERLQPREFLQSAYGIGVRVRAQDLNGGGELLARLGVTTPVAQGPPGCGLGASGGPGLTPSQVVIASAAGLLDRHGEVRDGGSGVGRADPQRPRIRLIVRGPSRRDTGRPEFGGGGVAGRGSGGGAGPHGALGGADQGGYGLVANLGGIRIAGDGVQGVQVVPGDDVGQFLPVAGEGLAQMRGHGQVPGLAVAAGQRVVGDLTEHVLGELVAAPLW